MLLTQDVEVEPAPPTEPERVIPPAEKVVAHHEAIRARYMCWATRAGITRYEVHGSGFTLADQGGGL